MLDGNRFTGAMPTAPPNLSTFTSDLCPNFFTPAPSAAWDAATGDTPWYSDCNTDVIFFDGFQD
ncbi:MAG TPA: hypothetical protein VM555_01615 [Tahibacter sp.]|nr:hypothetical protein [Tahibacter sp.]